MLTDRGGAKAGASADTGDCMRIPKAAFQGALLAMLAGCAAKPAVNMYKPEDLAATDAAQPATYSDTDWAEILRDNVHDGLVDYRHLTAHAEPLKRYLDLVQHVGPQSTPDQFREPNAALAYYINVYNAGVLDAVLRAGVPITMYDLELPPVERGYRFLVDGKPHTLGDIHALAEQSAEGNARVELALSGAALGTPPLANEPYRPFDVRQRLLDLGELAVSNPHLVRVDHEHQELLVGLPIMAQRDAFIEMYKRETASPSGTMLNCLMHMAGSNQRAYLARATGYDVHILPFDRTLNAWKPNAG